MLLVVVFAMLNLQRVRERNAVRLYIAIDIT